MELLDFGDSEGVLRALVIRLDHPLRQVHEAGGAVQLWIMRVEIEPGVLQGGGEGTVAIAKVLGPVGALWHIARPSQGTDGMYTYQL